MLRYNPFIPNRLRTQGGISHPIRGGLSNHWGYELFKASVTLPDPFVPARSSAVINDTMTKGKIGGQKPEAKRREQK
jgi:hypothetical protein